MSTNSPSNSLRKLPVDSEKILLKQLFLFGVSHKNTEVEVREKLSFNEQEEATFIGSLLSSGLVSEVVVFSTCNRTEIVLASHVPADELTQEVESRLSSFSGLSLAQLKKSLYVFSDRDVVSHLFKVTSGLDSMVLGEPQVTGQIKASYQRACALGGAGSVLNRLFHRAFGTTKLVRTNTGIGRKAVSVSYAAKELAQQIFGSLSEVSVLLIGAGQTGELASKHLKSAGVKDFIIANRTIEKAKTLAENLSGKSVGLSDIENSLIASDVVIGASRVEIEQDLVSKEMVKASLKARYGRPQFFIDLGVPRNFEASIDQLSDSFLYTVDDLQEVVRQNVDSRSLEVERAELIVDQEVERFYHWFEMRKLEPAIRQLKEHFESVAGKEVAKTTKRLRRAGYAVANEGELDQSLEAMAHSIVAKLLHNPISQIKSESETDETFAQRVLELFLDTE